MKRRYANLDLPPEQHRHRHKEIPYEDSLFPRRCKVHRTLTVDGIKLRPDNNISSIPQILLYILKTKAETYTVSLVDIGW